MPAAARKEHGEPEAGVRFSGGESNRALDRAVRFIGAAAAAMGAFWIMAWLAGWAARWSTTGLIIIKTNTAVCLLLGGTALFLLGPLSPRRSRRIVGISLALFLTLIGLLTLSEHIFGIDLGIDQLLAVEAPGAAATVSPNRMGPPASVSVVLLGAGLLFLAVRRRRWPATYIGLAVVAINLVPGIGFLYGITVFYKVPRVTGIALPTVLTLLALGIGLILSRRDGGPVELLSRRDAGGRLARRMLPVAILIPLLIGWLHVVSERQSLADRDLIEGVWVLGVIALLGAIVWRGAWRLSQSTAAEAEALRVSRANESKVQELMASLRALAEQEKLRLGAAVEQASDSVVMIDPEGRIQYVNAAFESINRIARDKAVGSSYFETLADPALIAAVRESIGRAASWRGRLTRPVGGGTAVELEVTVSPAQDHSGAVIGGLVTEKDVTQENALQAQIRQAQKMEALGTLAGGITHDFNNILGSIIVNTELALFDVDPGSPARRPLPLILQAAHRGRDLVKQIITFSRQRAWERKPLEIAPVIADGVRFLRSTLAKDLTITESIDGGSGVVLADPSHINQVLVNLCQNAALAMADRSGTIGVSLRPVVVDAGLAARVRDLKPGPFVRLTVEDDGCGMSKEVMERIFDPFFTTRRHGQGSGLGLSVVQGIVTSYGGAINVSSEPGKGSVFDVYIPRLEGEAVPAEPAVPRPARKGTESILLVEDEESQRESVTRGLERLGYRVTARPDGRSALAEFKKNPAVFDLVITDQIMPMMSGLALAAELVKVRPGVPVVLCTGFSERVDGDTVGKNGIRALVMKPFGLQEISREIRAALEAKSGLT